MGLTIVRADRGDRLADVLADRLRTPLPDPLAAEQVVVHSRGVERWLSQHLAGVLGVAGGGDGVAANIHFPFPSQVVRSAIRAAGGPDPQRSPWAPARLQWPLLQLVESGLGSWAAPLLDRIAADPAGRLGVLRGVAEQLDAAAVHRPDLVLRWLDGADVDAAGRQLPDADRWQPRLLRAVRDHLGHPTLAESVVDAVAGMRPPRDLPPRISAFGFTAIPAAHLAVLVALAGVIDVDLYLLHPSPGLWDRWSGIEGSLDDRGLPVLPLRVDADLPAPANRLLRSWGRDAAEMQVVVQTIAGGVATPDVGARPASRPAAGRPGLLQVLQDAVRRDADPAPGTAAPDGSIQVHACHGRARQVQVLRDEILRLLAAHDDLEPRDVVVMCPDVEAFAPLVQAHLAVPADDPDGRPDLRVRLADRSLRQVNPLLRALDDLLGLAAGRVTLTRLLDLAAAAPVRRRFGLSDDDLALLGSWAVDAGIRWGLDPADRRRDGVAMVEGTVQRGLTRVLLGAAMADEDLRTIAGVTPLDEVEGTDAQLAGRLAELAARLGLALTALRSPQPLAAWIDALATAADRLLLAPADQPWQRTQVTDLLADVLDEGAAATGAPPDVAIGLAEVRALLADRLRGQPSWANHRTGDLTVCTLVPMRSVPHRVVCLLGMDDEVFPRRPHAVGDDLVARDPRIGDRDARTEDRQLLLDAVMSATDAVVITYAGVDDRTGADRPPCVPVAELVRAVDDLTGVRGGITRSHPLHAHDPAAFGDRPGFDPQARAGALALARAASPDAPSLDLPPLDVPPLDVPAPAEVAVDRLIAFARNPVAHFYRQAVGIHVPDDPEPVDEQVPICLGGLQHWAVGDALLRHRLDGSAHDHDRVLAVLAGRGQLPPSPLADRQVDKIVRMVDGVVDLVARSGLPVWPTGRRDVDADVAGRRLVGTVGQLDGCRHVVTSFSKVQGKAIASAWITLLALTLDDPAQPWDAVVVGRNERKERGMNPPHAVHIPPLGATTAERRATAHAAVADLLALHDDALRTPLVAPAASACAYAMRRVVLGGSARDADADAALRWDPDDDRPGGGDAHLPAHLLLFGDAVPYDVLRAQPPRPQDVPAGQQGEPHRLGGLAVRLWGPPLSRCRPGAP